MKKAHKPLALSKLGKVRRISERAAKHIGGWVNKGVDRFLNEMQRDPLRDSEVAQIISATLCEKPRHKKKRLRAYVSIDPQTLTAGDLRRMIRAAQRAASRKELEGFVKTMDRKVTEAHQLSGR